MRKIELSFWIYDVPLVEVSIKERHRLIVQRMKSLHSPFSWRDLEAPPAPQRPRGSFIAQYEFRYPTIPVDHGGGYHIRDGRFLFDKARYDDFFSFEFKLGASGLEYAAFVHQYGAELVAAIGAYRATLNFGDYRFGFQDIHADEYQAILRDDEIDTNGRNNIFHLNPVHCWNENLCQAALGYGRDEAIRRLTGKVPRVEPLMDGVYIVFNDNPDLTFEEYCAYNDALKPVLGLV